MFKRFFRPSKLTNIVLYKTAGPWGPVVVPQNGTLELAIPSGNIVFTQKTPQFFINAMAVPSLEDAFIQPDLPDMSVLYNLPTPLFLPPEGNFSVNIFLPTMVQVMVRGSKEPAISQMAYKLPRGWFGSNTMEGKLCYCANHTTNYAAEFQINLAVHFKNLSSRNQQVSRFLVPSGFLSLYQDNQRFVSDDLQLVIEDDNDMHYQVNTVTGFEPIKTSRQSPSGLAYKHFSELITKTR